MATFRILVVDDHEVVRWGIRSLLASHEGWEVCGEAADGREAVEKATRIGPDLVILDLCMPRLNGLEAARQILRRGPGRRILILTHADSEQTMREALEIGVRGFLLKSDPGGDLVTAVEALQVGRTFFTSRMNKMILDGFLKAERHDSKVKAFLPGLTAREREVIQLVAEGSSTKEVATILGLSVKTAETHRNNIMHKLGLHSVSELVLYAVRNRIIHVSDHSDFRMPPPPASWESLTERVMMTAPGASSLSSATPANSPLGSARYVGLKNQDAVSCLRRK